MLVRVGADGNGSTLPFGCYTGLVAIAPYKTLAPHKTIAIHKSRSQDMQPALDCPLS